LIGDIALRGILAWSLLQAGSLLPG